MDMTDSAVIKQHLIDPEICIRCNTCETMCPVGAITHDSRNYVVDASKCNGCNNCISPCPTGSIDNYRSMPLVRAYSLQEQLGWDELPAELSREQLAELSGGESVAEEDTPALVATASVQPGTEHAFDSAQFGATLPPWSAAHAYTNLYGPNPRNPATDKHITAAVVGNVRVTDIGKAGLSDYDTHHIVLDFGSMNVEFRFLGDTDPTAFQTSGGFDIDTFLARNLTAGGTTALAPSLLATASFTAQADGYTFTSFSFNAVNGAVFTAVPVPEPGTWALMLTGAGLVLRLVQRQRRAA